jgi:hypothetical protein
MTVRALGLTLAAALTATACSTDADLEGRYRGNGDNRLVLEDGRWRLDSGLVGWVGGYAVDDDLLVLETERVIPELGHGTDCYDDVERYSWSFDDGILVLRLQAPEPCNRNRNSVLQTAAWRRIG